jgi:dolichol-phosphate mannosyltransferase
VIPELVASILRGRDLAVGSRYIQRGIGARWDPFRLLLSAAGILATRPLRIGVSDPLSGFFLVRRGCVENLLFQQSGFKLLLEILVRGRVETIEEVPFAFARRRAGRSKLSIKVAWDYVALLLRLYRGRWGSVRMTQVSGD